MSVKVLLDTDIGSDMDDAVCLAYLLARSDCDLLGITTVTGDVVARASMASAICRVAGKSIPIFPGCEKALLIEQRQPLVPQAAALNRWPHETKFPRGQAIEFMRRTVRDNPGEVTLLAIGPMTNVAALFAADEEIPSLLKSLVLMCGVFTTRLPDVPTVEWNAYVDPAAAGMVYRAPVKSHRSVGLDVTCQVKMPAAQVRERFQNAPLLQPVLDFAEVWFQKYSWSTFHDPLAAVSIFDPAVCGFERGAVDVELESRRLAGFTHWSAGGSGPHEVALTVDVQRFFDQYFSVF